MIASRRAVFRAVAETVVPEMRMLDAAGWAHVEETVTHMLTRRPERQRRQLGLLLGVIESLPRLTTGRAFSALDPVRRTRWLEALQRAPVPLVRRGLWGLRTLVLMGYYTHADTMRAIGYRADARGWSARGSAGV